MLANIDSLEVEKRKRHAVAKIITHTKEPTQSAATGFAPANIALCKYWGKRDTVLNLPLTSSLSISLGTKGTSTKISLREGNDSIELNGQICAANDPFAVRLSSFLDLFRPRSAFGFKICTHNTIPTSAGLASSASGFAALVTALDQLFSWQLEKRALSILARLGSGSASRSVYTGFVEWHAGSADDGSDSYAQELETTWPELRLGLLTLSAEKKAWDSRSAMQHTQATSPFYSEWPRMIQADLATIKEAIENRNFEQLGQASESNALALHALILSARPSILYWKPETLDILHRIEQLRRKGLAIYATIDAGPNIKLIFLESATEDVRTYFPEVEIIVPFAATAKTSLPLPV